MSWYVVVCKNFIYLNTSLLFLWTLGWLMEEKWRRGICLKNTTWVLVKKEWPMRWKLLIQTTTQDKKRIPHAKQTPFCIELISLFKNYMWIKTKNWKCTLQFTLYPLMVTPVVFHVEQQCQGKPIKWYILKSTDSFYFCFIN